MKTGHRNLFSISQYEMENKNAMEISVLLLLFQENKQFSALSCVIPNVKANKYNAYQASDSPLPSINNGYDECVQKHCQTDYLSGVSTKKYINSYDVFFWTFYSNIISSKKRIIILSNKQFCIFGNIFSQSDFL